MSEMTCHCARTTCSAGWQKNHRRVKFWVENRRRFSTPKQITMTLLLPHYSVHWLKMGQKKIKPNLNVFTPII